MVLDTYFGTKEPKIVPKCRKVSKSVLRRQFNRLPLALSVWTFETSLMDLQQARSSLSDSFITDISIFHVKYDRSVVHFRDIGSRSCLDRRFTFFYLLVWASTSSSSVIRSLSSIVCLDIGSVESTEYAKIPDRCIVNLNQYFQYRIGTKHHRSAWSRTFFVNSHHVTLSPMHLSRVG